MTHKKSLWVLGLYVSVLLLLPFARLAELPILLLSITGIYGLLRYRADLAKDERFKILTLIFGCYFFMVLFSALDSYNQVKSFQVGVASLRFYLAAIAMILFLKKTHFSALIHLITLVTVFFAIDAMFQHFMGYDFIGRTSYDGRLNGIFGQSNVKLGPVLALLLPIAMSGLQKYSAVFRWLSLFTIICAIILSGTRSAWLMLIFALIAYWFSHVKQKRMAFFLKGVAALSIMTIGLWFLSNDFQQRIQRTMTIFQGTEQGIDFALANRLPIWKTSINMMKDHPINGIGAHAFRNAYPKFASDDDVWQNRGGVGMHAHHWVLEVLSETGMIGLILMITAIYYLLAFMRRFYQDKSWGFLVAIMCAFLPLTSTFSMFASFWSICLWFIGAGLITISYKLDDKDD